MKTKPAKKLWLVVVDGPHGKQEFNVMAVSQRYAEAKAEREYRKAHNHSGRMNAGFSSYLPTQEN